MRQTGRTTRQLAALPPNSIFFVHTQSLKSYVRRLCEKLGRNDIRVESLVFLRDQCWRGLEFAGADIDHLSKEFMEAEHEIAWRNLQPYIRRPAGTIDAGEPRTPPPAAG